VDSKMNNYRNIGKIVAAYGLKGELILHHRLGKKTSLKGLEMIFLEEKHTEMLPYFLEAVKIKSDKELFIKLEGVDSKEIAGKFLQKEVWLTEEDFEKYAGKSAPISLVGHRLINEGKDLGEILEVMEQAHQVLCRIEIHGKEVLIPLHEKTLQKVDRNKKQVFVILPAGLLDVYL
jgi:16S rRNA processing protein RimM